MAPNQSFVLSSVSLEPVSRTYQYRKVMKPMLERKRRARINRCLDELKELMAGALQSEGENVAKLEKADILELTVRHLHNLREKKTLFLRQDQLNNDRFWEGFRHCAAEVTQFLAKFDQKMGAELLSHITGCVQSQQLAKTQVNLPRPDIFLINPYRYEDLLLQNSSSKRRHDINYIRDPSGNIDDNEESTVWRPW